MSSFLYDVYKNKVSLPYADTDAVFSTYGSISSLCYLGYDKDTIMAFVQDILNDNDYFITKGVSTCH